MSDFSIRSDQEAVKAWLRGHSGELLSVGIKLELTATEQTELQNRLVLIRQDFDGLSAIKTNFEPNLISHGMKNDPMKVRWLNDQKYEQGEQGQAK